MNTHNFIPFFVTAGKQYCNLVTTPADNMVPSLPVGNAAGARIISGVLRSLLPEHPELVPQPKAFTVGKVSPQPKRTDTCFKKSAIWNPCDFNYPVFNCKPPDRYRQPTALDLNFC
jgi:hypothetical protein